MSRARFPVVGLLDQASRPVRGTLTIDRTARILEVRPHRRRKVYRLPLDTVATLVCRQIIRAELAEQRKAKKKRRRRRQRRT